MNSFSHFMIGSYLHQYIKIEYGMKLSATRFLYWNIMADFRKPYRTPPHKADFWESHLKGDIAELAGHKQSQPRFGTDYSKRLGVICHFYADFFCYVHTAAYKGTSWQHVKYELELYRFMRKSFPAICPREPGSGLSANRETGDIFGYYKTLQKSYHKETQSFENDVGYTLRACLDTVTMITRASLQESIACPGCDIPVVPSLMSP